jgi:RNA polymerase sigma-70 factor (ECF subfamily)
VYSTVVQSLNRKKIKPGLRRGLAHDERTGDALAAFRSVVLPNLNASYNLARWLTGDRTSAEDVIQDASLHAFLSIHRFAGNNARAWVLRIVRNTAYSWLRKNRPTAIVEVDDFQVLDAARVDSSDPDVETPETTVMGKTGIEHLRAAIASLPISFRETLVLHDIEGLGYREIAEATEVPVGTVMSRLAGARGQLIATVRQGTDIGGPATSSSAVAVTVPL